MKTPRAENTQGVRLLYRSKLMPLVVAGMAGTYTRKFDFYHTLAVVAKL